jgi:O-antigen ligase
MTDFALPARAVLVGVVAAVSAAFGLAAAMFGERFGLAAMLGLPLVVLLLVAMLARPAFAPALVLLVIPVGLKTLPIGFVLVQGAAMVAIVAVMLVRLSRGQAPTTWSAVLAWGLAVFSLCLASTPHAQNTTLATKQDIDVALGLLVVLTAMSVTVSLDTLRRLAHLLLAVGAGIALLGLGHARAIQSVAGGQRVDHRLRGTFTEPNQFGGFCAIVVIVALGVMLGAKSRRERWLAGAVAAVSTAALLLALSRGAWIGFMLAGLLLLTLVPGARRALGFGVVVVFLAAPLLGLVTKDVPQVTVVRERVATLHLPTRTPYDSRPDIWREAVREILAAPVLGQGPGQFPVVSRQATSEASTVYAYHAHNVLLTVAAEAGIPAALMLIGFTLTLLVMLVRTVARLRGSPDAALVAGLGSALAVVVGQGLVDFTLRNADIFLLLSVIVGLLLGAARLASAAVPIPVQQRQ